MVQRTFRYAVWLADYKSHFSCDFSSYVNVCMFILYLLLYEHSVHFLYERCYTDNKKLESNKNGLKRCNLNTATNVILGFSPEKNKHVCFSGLSSKLMDLKLCLRCWTPLMKVSLWHICKSTSGPPSTSVERTGIWFAPEKGIFVSIQNATKLQQFHFLEGPTRLHCHLFFSNSPFWKKL